MLLLTDVDAASLKLVRNGEPRASIVLAAEPTRAASMAAGELQEHVRLITGANLPIVRDAAQVEGIRILVGESDATRALGLRSEDFASQEYLIQAQRDTLVLMGRDEAPSPPGQGSQPATAEGRFGAALEFDGVEDVIVAPDCGFADAAGSLEAWVYLSTTPQEGESTILRLDGGGPWSYHILRRWPHSNAIGYSTYDGETVRNVSSGELAEGWHHLLATYDVERGTSELLVDGESCGTAAYVRSTCAGAALHIGGMGLGATGTTKTGNPFAGRIDEVRVSSVVRAPELGQPPVADQDTELLLRFDEAGRGLVDASPHSRNVVRRPGWYDEKGTLNAVYDFLERHCGVRWYMPTPIGAAYEPRATLRVDVKPIRRTPTMIHRWMTPTTLYLPTKADPAPTAEADLWKLRMRIGGQAFWVCHSFGGYYERFYEDHPDWFAQGYEGKPGQVCFTNDEVVAQVAEDARDFFDGKRSQPGAADLGDVFGIVPEDNSRYCQCDNCLALLDETEMDNPQFSNGRWSRLVWSFVNRVAREVKTTHPDKWIGALAYWDYAYYPEGLDLEPNVVVQMCLHTRNWFCPSMEVNDTKVFTEWVDAESDRRPMYLWLYYNFPALQSKYGGWNGFPSYFAHTAAEQMEMYREAGMRGVFFEHSSEFGETHLIDVPDLYISLRMAEDGQLDGNALIDEFFDKFYGAASVPMREAYGLIEDAYITPERYPEEIRTSPGHQHQTEELAWGSLGTEALLTRLTELVDEAEGLAETQVEKDRVDLFRRGILDYMLAGKQQYEAGLAP
ncbi:MAG TPA: DUF4838 domain-containing protein [Armatimonadota bacterium]|nr:DUF4838 domain-containing protein [Armatimonadota bacterium]